ncbi:MAG TPA: hypothetical protein DEG88_12740 [Propionibacteriaceae bacterium]|nr:hypothetical protein [Micropruina sp.]HBX81305.1 hypothetical protein [Propionibacteriaceae bacterium]HBY24096.1 hypothetical protein [Propionibacteriaceae bacterium]
MSALVVEDYVAVAPLPRARLRVVPDERPMIGDAPAATRPRPQGGVRTGELHLTQRGLAVVMAAFVGAVAIAAIVLVVSFLSISNAPIAGAGSNSVAAAVR